MSSNLTILSDPTNRTCLLLNVIHRSFGFSVALAVIFTILTILTALGNIFVITAVARIKKLQHPSNLLIVSLACSDLLVSIMVMPFGSYYEYNQIWDLGEVACDIFIVFDVLLCTASILNICAISIDRYLVITRPLAYDIKRTPKRMLIMITSAWVSAALISIPPTFGFKDPFMPGVCSYSKNLIYQIYATFGAFYVPLIVMLTLYGRIVVLARRIVHSENNRTQSGSERGQSVITPSVSESQLRQENIWYDCLRCCSNKHKKEVYSETVHRDSSPNNILVTQFDKQTVPHHAPSADRSLTETPSVNEKCKAIEVAPNAYPALPKTTTTTFATEASEDSLRLKSRDRGHILHHYRRLPPPLHILCSQSNGFDKPKPCEPTEVGVPVSATNALSARPSMEYTFAVGNRPQNTLQRQPFSVQVPLRSQQDSSTCFPFHLKTFSLGHWGTRNRSRSVNVAGLCNSERRRQPSRMRQRGSSGTYFQQQQQQPTKKVARRRSSEKKAIRTLGVLMGVFCFCWLPFFIIALGLPLYNYINKTNKDINPHLKSVLLWLGYINSTINPMIYTIFNRDFREPLYEILHCRCRGINARMRVKQYELEYGPSCSIIFHSEAPAFNPRLSTQTYSPLLMKRYDTRENSLLEETPA